MQLRIEFIATKKTHKQRNGAVDGLLSSTNILVSNSMAMMSSTCFVNMFSIVCHFVFIFGFMYFIRSPKSTLTNLRHLPWQRAHTTQYRCGAINENQNSVCMRISHGPCESLHLIIFLRQFKNKQLIVVARSHTHTQLIARSKLDIIGFFLLLQFMLTVANTKSTKVPNTWAI